MIVYGGEMVPRDPERAHTPVLVPAVLRSFAEGVASEPGGWLVDGTLGAGGHARALLEAYPGLRVLGVDQDPDALELARENLAPFIRRVVVKRGRLSQLAELCAAEGVRRVVGVLFDLGASSMHFDRPERGFSVHADGPLDMRMDPDRERTAADVVNTWDEADLADLLYYEGGERHARRIAAAIVEGRRRTPFRRTAPLAELVARASSERGGRIHPATRTFQALRRAVNEEGEELLRGLALAEDLLTHGGRLVVITFHSGEDGIVKRFVRDGSRAGRWRVVTKKPLAPAREERLANPRSRSARLRCAERQRAGRPTSARRLEARGGGR